MICKRDIFCRGAFINISFMVITSFYGKLIKTCKLLYIIFIKRFFGTCKPFLHYNFLQVFVELTDPFFM